MEAILASQGLPVTSAQYFTNIIDIRTKGIDLTANYRAIVGATARSALSTADYSRGQSNILGRVSHYGTFNSAPGLCETCEQEFGARTLFDLEIGHRFGGVRWALGARNLFDTYSRR